VQAIHTPLRADWSASEVPYHTLDRAEVADDPILFHVLVASSFLESTASLYTQNLIEYYAGDAEIEDWLREIWEPEELKHGLAMRRYVEAIDYFERALASKERALTAQMRNEVSQLLNQARSFVTKLNLTVTPADAQLALDTRAAARDQDGAILLDPGTHELVIEAPNHETVTRSIRGDGGETLTLAINLRYKALSVDYDEGVAGPGYFAYDTITHGPLIGLSFTF